MKKTSSKKKIRQISVALRRQRRLSLRKLSKKIRLFEVRLKVSQHQQMLRDQGLIVGGNANRRPIILPENLSFWENYEETSKCLEDIRKHGLGNNCPLEIRFDKVKFLEPSATLALAAEIYRCQKLRIYRGSRFVSGNYPFDATVYGQLRDMGFFRLLEIGDHPGFTEEKKGNVRPLFLPFITDNRVIAEGVNRFVGIIEKHLIPMNKAARGKLVAAIKEAMGNVFDHAYQQPTDFQSMPHRWFMSARVDVEQHEVMIVLHDQGNGIPSTLDADLIDRVRAALSGHIDRHLHASDGYVIKLATELWRTGTGQAGRGRGFRNMKSFVDQSTDGELRVLSNRGFYTYIGDSEHYGDNATPAGGTTIVWRFRSDVPLEMNDD